MTWLNKNLLWLIVGIIALYVAGAFAAPVFMVRGDKEVAGRIYRFYGQFCHQRVERSVFLFGKESIFTTYSVSELKVKSAIPDVNPDVRLSYATTYFGHGFNGNQEVGYKAAICIRDLALYLSLVISSSVYIAFSKKRKLNLQMNWKFLLVLILPLIVDGGFQVVAESLKLSWVPQAYFDNNPKRVITGVLFGTGIALLIFPPLKKSLEEAGDTVSA